MMKFVFSSVVLSVLGLCPLRVLAHSAHGEKIQNHQAHTHGTGEITLIYERGRLLMELQTPAINMLGFEHTPMTQQQWQIATQVLDSLRAPDRLVSLKAKCELKSVHVDMPFEFDGATILKNATEFEHHPAQNKHPHSSAKPHYESEHSDIRTEYEWFCEQEIFPLLVFQYFELYPGFEKLTVNWIVNAAQGSTTLNPRKNSLEIGQ